MCHIKINTFYPYTKLFDKRSSSPIRNVNLAIILKFSQKLRFIKYHSKSVIKTDLRSIYSSISKYRI